MSQPTPLPRKLTNSWIADYGENQLIAYGKSEYERGLEDAAQALDTYDDMGWSLAHCRYAIRALKGKP